MSNTIDKILLQNILRKRQNSEQLNDKEEAYARKLFSDMMDSKKQVRKVVRIVTGEQLRKEETLQKSKVTAEATRKDPRYPQGKNPQSIKGENTDPDVNSLKSKLPDADEKPKAGPTYEHQRLMDMTQEAVPPRSEAVKFVSADPVHKGDIVSKNMAREGQFIVKGVVLNVKDGVAFVKWANGRTMYEHAHLLVKVKKSEAAAPASEVKDDPKLGVSESEEDAKNTPMTKQASRRPVGYPSRVVDPTRIGSIRSGGTSSIHRRRRLTHEAARHGLLGSGGRGKPVGGRIKPGRKVMKDETTQKQGPPIRREGWKAGAREALRQTRRPLRTDPKSPAGRRERVGRGARILGAAVLGGRPHRRYHRVGGVSVPTNVRAIRHEAGRVARRLRGEKVTKQGNVKERARQVGQAVRGAARGVTSAVESAYRRRRASKLRQQVMRQPRQHAVRATQAAMRGNVGRAIREGYRAAGARGPARAAREMDVSARRTFGVTGRRRGATGFKPRQKMQKDGDIAMAPNYGSVAPSETTTTPFQDLTSSLQDVVRLAGDLKGKQEKTNDEDVKKEYDKLIGQLRGVAETILSGLNSELEEAEAEYDKENE